MKKTRKYLSLFAILLMVIFAVGCVFMTACGSKDDDDEKESTHTTHTWDDGVATKEATCGVDGEMMYTCTVCGETKTEAIAATGDHKWDDGKVTTEATCGKDGETTYTCTVCGATKTETITATGEHKWNSGEVTTPATCVDGEMTYTCTACGATKTEAITATADHTYSETSAVDWNWVWDDETGYSATAKVTCDVCKIAYDADEVNVTAPEGSIYGDYTAMAKIGNQTYTDTKTAEEPQLPYDPEKNVYSLSVDFSNPDDYAWIGTPATAGTDEDTGAAVTYLDVTAGTYKNGLLTFVGISGQTIGKDGAGALYTSSNSGSYFMIDLTGLESDYITISVGFSTNGNDGDSRGLYVSSSNSTSSSLASATSSGKKDFTTLDYGQLIAEGDELYLTWSQNIRIQSIEINIYGDVEPEATTEITLDQTALNLTLTDGTATGTVTATIVDASGEPYTGELPTVESSDTTNVEVSIVKATDDGTYTINVTVKAEIEDVTITATVDGVSAEFTVSAKEASVTMAVNKSYMSLSSIGGTDSSVVTLTDEWGVTYGGGDVQITPTSDNESIATASYENGKVVVTAVGNGSTTITVAGTWGTESIGSFTINVTVAISSFSDDDTTYTLEAKAVVTDSTAKTGSYTTTSTDTATESPITVEVPSSQSANNFATREKKTVDESVTYSDYAEVGTSKRVQVTIEDGVTADITVYASHTSSAARTLYISQGEAISGSTILAGETIDSSAGDTSYLIPVTVTGLGAGTYQINADATVHVYAVVVTYKYNSDEEVGTPSEVASADELTAALEAETSVISLTGNITGTFGISYTVTLNLGEYKITNASTDTTHTITVKEGGKLTIAGTGTVDSIVDNYAAVYVEVGGEAILNGGTYTRSGENTTGGTYYTIVNQGTMTINADVTVKTEAVTNSSMVENGWADPTQNTSNSTAKMTINGGTFESSSNSMIKNDECGYLLITGGTFNGNGTATVVLNCAELEISSGTFTQNRVKESTDTSMWNYVVWNYENSDASLYPTAKISGGSFSGGTLATIGNDDNGTLIITGGTFDNALYAVIYGGGTIVITDGTFTSSGSGLYIYIVWSWSTTIITGGTFTAGDATDSVLVPDEGSTFIITGGTFGGVDGATIIDVDFDDYDEEDGDVCPVVIIYGGTFGEDPSEYLADGYVATETTFGEGDDEYTMYVVAAEEDEPDEGGVTPSGEAKDTGLISITDLVSDGTFTLDTETDETTGETSTKETSFTDDVVMYEGEDGTKITVKATSESSQNVSVDANSKSYGEDPNKVSFS